MATRPSTRRDLLAWLAHLEAAGLCRTSPRLVDECARILAMPGAWRSPEDLADALSSRLASDPRTWRALRDHLLAFVAVNLPPADTPPSPPPPPTVAAAPPLTRPQAAAPSERLAALLRRIHISGLAWLFLLGLLVALAVVFGPRLLASLADTLFPPPWLDNLLATVRQLLRPPETPPPGEHFAVLPESGSLLTPLEVDLPAPPGLPGPTWLLVVVLLLSLLLALLAALWWTASTAFRDQLRAAADDARRAREAAQARSRASSEPYHIPRHLWIARGELDDAATLLGRTRPGGLGDELDVPSTLARTIDAGGRFVPVFHPATLRPLPIVLVDTEEGHPYLDPVDHLLDHWRAAGLRFDRYDFEWSPTQLTGRPDGRPTTLEDLARHTEGRPLLLFSRMSQPRGYEGRVEWLRHLVAWPARAWIDLDPRPLAEHPDKARRLRDHLVASGLQRFTFTGPDLLRAARTLATGEPVHPATERPLLPVAELEPALWRWAACAAIVPDPTWPQLEALRRDLPGLARRLPEPRLVHRLCEWARHRHLGRDGRDYLIGTGPRLVFESTPRLDLIARLRTEDPELATQAHELLERQLLAASAEGDPFGEALRQAKLDYHRAFLHREDASSRLLAHLDGSAAREVQRMVRDELAIQQRQAAIAGPEAPPWDPTTRDTLEAHTSNAPGARLLDLLRLRPLDRPALRRTIPTAALALLGAALWLAEETGRLDIFPTHRPERVEAWITTPATWKVTRIDDDLLALADVAPLRLIPLPGGEFLMGSPETEDERERDELQHRAHVAPFAAGETEVTHAQWATVMHTDPSDCNYGCDNAHPVQNVTWNDACRFTIALTERENAARKTRSRPLLTACYIADGDTCAWPAANKDCTGFRLPTEAEWEYAARASTRTAYSFGDDPKDLCAHANVADESAKKKHPDWTTAPCDDSYPDLAPVASFETNAWGLHDTHGNVWEWVWDWYDDYPTNEVSDRGDHIGYTGPRDGTRHILRGGSFENSPRGLRSACRNWHSTTHKSSAIGFRVVRAL